MNSSQNQRAHNSFAAFPPFQSYLQAHSSNHIPKECPICLWQHPHYEMVALTNCQHQFCIHCLQQHITTQLSRHHRVFCPDEKCGKMLVQSSPFFGRLTEEQRIKFQKINTYFEILNNPQLKPCQKQNCVGVFNISIITPKCNKCSTQHCPQCFHFSHEGECQAKIAINIQLQQKYRQCSQCGQIIQKIQGCTHMSCTCGHYFCYSCGETLIDEHICKPPEQLSWMHKIRWEIQHEQLWYQSNRVNFLKYLNKITPDKQMSDILKYLWCFVYAMTLYPLTLILSLTFVVIVCSIILSLMVLFSLMIPFWGLCSGNNLYLFPTQMMLQECGLLPAFLTIIVFYPFVYLINVCQVLYRIIVIEGLNFQQISRPFYHPVKGIRNFGLIPCLMLINNQSYYLTLAKNRDIKPNQIAVEQPEWENANQLIY